MSDDLTIEELVERSSLGTLEAKAARTSVSDEQVAEVMRRVRRGGIQLGYIVNNLSLTMRCAWIAEKQQPGSGMAWIENDLAEANAIPGHELDLEPDDCWDGTETAQAYHDRTRRALFEEREETLARLESSSGRVSGSAPGGQA